ncbi:MAG: class I SAM-dependent methyltransferase [Halioglobus sp.]|nr:class I SAM-dependent methyltransferase [Halioglobus sp.]
MSITNDATDSGHKALAVQAATTADEGCAVQLAQRLGLPLLTADIDLIHVTRARAVLIVSGQSLSLQQTGRGAPGPVVVDFGSPSMRYRSRSGTSELLGKAVGHGKKVPLRVLDATAGLGRDAFVLAGLGCEVVMCERDPAILEMLRCGLQSAAANSDAWLSGVIQRMRLCSGDAQHLAAKKLQGVDVIYLDPMFPQRAKSAAVKKEMALFQVLLECSANPQDADALLVWALAQDTARVVVKRPSKAPSLATLKPSHCIAGKSVRYDVYVHRKLY